MGENNLNKDILIIGIAIMFFILAMSPISFGCKIRTPNIEKIVENNNFDSYYTSEISNYEQHISMEYSNNEPSPNINLRKASTATTNDLIDSPWPMYCHDTRHTGRSPYSTTDNNGYEKWRFATVEGAQGDVAIDADGTIYIGSTALYAIYPNGLLKWKYVTDFQTECAPAIDENGILYFGNVHGDYLYALYTSNGTLKWELHKGSIYSSPAIGEDGTIFFGTGKSYPPYGYINAYHPNGTLKWRYRTDHLVYSSPAIGDEGTVYCGSHDTYLYALYENNGTLKWKYKTGHWIRTSPCIADDGTIYVVSLDHYLHAVNPDGTLKWKTDVGAGTSPTIGQDGTIYAGYDQLYAINPTNGSVKWTFDVGGAIQGGTPCNSIDGTIYVGTSDGGELIAINPDGTEKWRRYIGECESAPAIGEDGTVYIGSNDGYLYAFGEEILNNPPNKPNITGPSRGKIDIEHEYKFVSTDPDGDDIWYCIEWEENNSEIIGPYASGEEVNLSNIWVRRGSYSIKTNVTDYYGGVSETATLGLKISRSKVASNCLFPKIFELCPRAILLVRHLFGIYSED